MDPSVKLEKASECAKELKYRELIGSLMFLAIVSRPDISYAVSSLAQHLTCWSQDHFDAGLRILRYLKGTSSLGIVYGKHANQVQVYSDSDFSGDYETRRSRSGTLVLINKAPVVWLSQKQPQVVLSSTEAEFVAATAASTYVCWLKNLLSEVGIQVTEAIDLFMDNQSAIKLIKNPEYHHKTKHIDIKYKFVREHFEWGNIDLKFVPTDKQLADFLTKPLAASKFNSFITFINMSNLN